MTEIPETKVIKLFSSFSVNLIDQRVWHSKLFIVKPIFCQWGTVNHQMAVPVPSINCCVYNNNYYFFQEQNELAFNWDTCCHLVICLQLIASHRTAHVRHQCRKTTVISCHICLINTGVEKNEQHLNVDYNFDRPMSASRSKFSYSNNCLHF